MLTTWLTERLGIRYPVISASMTGVAHGQLARAVSRAGGLGMLGIGSQVPIEALAQEARIASDGGALPFGVGLTAWALPDRPELLEATVEQRPALVSLSFGPIRARDVELLHTGGILVSAQVHSPQAARDAAAAGVDLVEAQGTEAGGHTGTVAMLPLLQRLEQEIGTPLLAAGGIATPGALAAILVAGAVGARIGTPLLLSQEAVIAQGARDRLRLAEVNDTVLSPCSTGPCARAGRRNIRCGRSPTISPTLGSTRSTTSRRIKVPCGNWPTQSSPATTTPHPSWLARPSASSEQDAQPLR